MSTQNRSPLVEIEKQGKREYLHCRLPLSQQGRRPELAQRWMVRAIMILSVAMGIMSIAVVGLVLLLTSLSGPEINQILLALLRLLLGVAKWFPICGWLCFC